MKGGRSKGEAKKPESRCVFSLFFILCNCVVDYGVDLCVNCVCDDILGWR